MQIQDLARKGAGFARESVGWKSPIGVYRGKAPVGEPGVQVPQKPVIYSANYTTTRNVDQCPT